MLRWFGLEEPGDAALPFPLDPDAASDAPFFTESKRQIGVIWQGHYLQRKRVFTDPAKAGSGLLPAERIGPVEGGACGDCPQRSRMLTMLREFEKGGDEAQARFEKERARKALTDEDRKALKALGYLE